MDGMRDISQALSSYSLLLTTCLHQMLKTRMCGPFCVSSIGLGWYLNIKVHLSLPWPTECVLNAVKSTHSFEIKCFVLSCLIFHTNFRIIAKHRWLTLLLSPWLLFWWQTQRYSILFRNSILINIRKWALERWQMFCPLYFEKTFVFCCSYIIWEVASGVLGWLD